MSLRKGKTKTILESSIEASLLAVEIYNKPRISFRVEGYITNMIIAWTRLFHAYFHQTIGDKFYYKQPNSNRYKIIDGEKKSWELKTCITKYNDLPEAVKVNLEFFIKLRNKIEHRHIDRDEIGILIFGECQSLLYNYENTLIDFFGEEYALNENLAYSLQFSRVRKKAQIEASKKLLSSEIKELKFFIDTYRTNLNDEIFNSQEYSIKLIQIPKITNTTRNDLAIEFVNWNSLSDDDRENYDKITTIIKDKVIKKEAINPGKMKPSEVISKLSVNINQYDYKCICFIFNIRPYQSEKNNDPFNTNINYCHYDEVHDDYVYNDEWVDFLNNIIEKTLTKEDCKKYFKDNIYLNIEDYGGKS